MDQITPAEVIDSSAAGGLDRRGSPQGLFRRVMRALIFLFSYHVVLSRKSIRTVRAAGFRLTVRPTVFHPRFFVSSGGLISYGPEVLDQFRRAAGYVDRILKGEKPADLPVQAPTRYELVINLKTAKALGIDVPPMLLARADEVIE